MYVSDFDADIHKGAHNILASPIKKEANILVYDGHKLTTHALIYVEKRY